MHGVKDSARKQKSVLVGMGSIAWVGMALWLFWQGSDAGAARLRSVLVIACGTGYLLRLALTMFVFVRRAVPWHEALIVGVWVWVIYGVFATLAAANPEPVNSGLWVGVALYLLGSFLNTWSEWQRHRFKQDPANRGRLFTGGLFRYSMHINYFGDSLLFAGFALVVGGWFAWTIPLIMTLGFLFQHIPVLDKYLAERYGDDFQAYQARTAKFVPLLY